MNAKGNDPGRRRRPPCAGHGDARPGAGRLRGHRRRQRRRRHPAGARAPPDLALLDIRMEGKSGFDVAEYLREFCHIPFMFLSAFADDETVAKVERARRGRLPGQAARRRARSCRRSRPPSNGCVPSARRPRRSARPQAARSRRAPRANVVSLAAGVLMHRYSLSRGDALRAPAPHRRCRRRAAGRAGRAAAQRGGRAGARRPDACLPGSSDRRGSGAVARCLGAQREIT